jgi:methylated-DNA-[protein]-cysteine S-methyltransferase
MTKPETDYSLVLDSPLGRLGLRLRQGRICALDYLPEGAPLKAGPGALAARIATQLSAYFRDPHSGFRVPLALTGTAFQRRVWEALLDIPPGATRSYGELAALLGTGARAVGNACRCNPVPIIVPCHRVIGAGSIGGYSGQTTAGQLLARKTWLLMHEGVEAAALKKRRPAPK